MHVLEEIRLIVGQVYTFSYYVIDTFVEEGAHFRNVFFNTVLYYIYTVSPLFITHTYPFFVEAGNGPQLIAVKMATTKLLLYLGVRGINLSVPDQVNSASLHLHSWVTAITTVVQLTGIEIPQELLALNEYTIFSQYLYFLVACSAT